MAAHAERGTSAPPEVVFNTATDRLDGWLPQPLRAQRKPQERDPLRARWEERRVVGRPDGRARRPGRRSGASQPRGDLPDDRSAQLADESLVSLAEHVDDNLTAG